MTTINTKTTAITAPVCLTAFGNVGQLTFLSSEKTPFTLLTFLGFSAFACFFAFACFAANFAFFFSSFVSLVLTSVNTTSDFSTCSGSEALKVSSASEFSATCACGFGFDFLVLLFALFYADLLLFAMANSYLF